MKKFIRTMLGVTLLEVLLVLVIASLVLVMSIRYYQTATTQAKVNAAMEIVTGIVAAVDSYIASGNTLSGASCSDSSCALSAYLPNGRVPVSPWGSAVTVTGGETNYTIQFGTVPTVACTNFTAALKSNSKIVPDASCGTLTVTP